MEAASDTQTSYEPPRTFSSPLRVYRVARNWSQSELAERAGITRVTVGALERGENEPQLATARALAAALGVSPDELFPDDGNRAHESPDEQRGRRKSPNMTPTPREERREHSRAAP